MDENISEDDNNEVCPSPKFFNNNSDNTINNNTNNNNIDNTNGNKNVKRLKIEDGSSSIEESSTSTNKTEHELPTTSSDSGIHNSLNDNVPQYFLHSKIPRNRNYRRSQTDDESSSSSESDDIPAFFELDLQSNHNNNNSVDNNNIADDDDDESINSTININTTNSDDSVEYWSHDTESENEVEACPVLQKSKPKNNWYIVPDLINRQIGYSSKLQSRELFMRKCYGSLRSVQRLELMYKLESHKGCVNSLNFHPNGDYLVSGADDLKIFIWDWKIGKCLLKFKSKHRKNIFQTKFLQLSGDLHIASSARDGQVRISRVCQEEGVRENRLLGCHDGPCHKLITVVDQPHIILSAGEDAFVINHDIRSPKSYKIVNVKEDGREIALYSIHGHPLKGNEFCISGRDEIVRVYDQRKTNTPCVTLSPFKKMSTSEYMRYHVTCAVYNHNGSEILATYSDEDIYLYSTKTSSVGNYLHRYQGHRNGATIKGVNFFGPKSEFIVSGSDCGHVYFWERNTESIVQWILADDNGVVNCLEPHPQLPFLCTSGLDWDIKVWVPSCENEPNMKELPNTIMKNLRLKINWSSTNNDGNESQMLWMLWRHLRNSNSLSRFRSLNERNTPFYINISSSSSSSISNSRSGSLDDVAGDNNDEDDDDDDDDDDDEEMDGPPNCNTS